jgi:dipeptidyl aminopeptidase/acylaminoacyl peptidase
MPEKRMITAEDLYNLQILSNVRMSPDGENILYTLQRVDRKTEKKYANIFMIRTDGKVSKQFTYGDQKDLSPRWSPDGSQIAFLSNRKNAEKPAQLFLIPFDGGEARPLTEIDGEINDFVWSPDGRKLLCVVRKIDAEDLEREKDEQKKKLGVVYRQYDRAFYKLDGYGYLPHERNHLWIVDVRTGRSKQLTDHAIYDEIDPAWSPDGESIAFVSNHTEEPDLNPDYADLFVMPAEGGEPRKIKAPIGSKTLPSFSPDGKWIAYLAQEGENAGYVNFNLWIAPADGNGKAKNLTEAHDLHCLGNIINDVGTPEQMPPTWSKDSKMIYFQTAERGSVLLRSIAIDGKDLREVIGEGGAVGAFTFDRDQTKVAYFYGRIDDPGQIYVRDLAGGSIRHLTRINREVLDRIELGSIEEVWFKGSAKNDLQGWILKPPGFNPRKKYPSILEIHGGPLTQYGKFFMHEFQYFAAKGYVVYFSNPRGGRGYGEKHSKAIWGDWGGADYDDIMSWTDTVAKQPYIDNKRMGVTGGSYGGYMTIWIIGHTKRFEAAVTQRCVSNFISEWGSSDFNWTFQQELEAGPPFDDLKKYWDMSPMKYIGEAVTPTMVIHNENDLRCPIEQGEQVFVALKRIGVPTEFIRFPDEFHGMSRTGRTDRRIARLNHILRWMDRYLKG